jgi:leucine dehydrogenase
MLDQHVEFDDHEAVVFCRDPRSGLRAIIAIHDTHAGPAMGGTRMASYSSEADAITDVLRLSRGMSFKNIMAGLPHGGGKAVIFGDPLKDKSTQRLRAFGEHVNRLGGTFITGEDVGISVSDVQSMRAVTPHVRGIPENGPGDPSPMTALGVFEGMKAAVRHLHGTADLHGARVLVQGLGAVGMRLAVLLHEAGAKLSIADINTERLETASSRLGAEVVPPDEWLAMELDIYAPCALGATLNEQTIPALKAAIVAGAANNQLATRQDGERLFRRGILYAPDYVINAGGVISTALEGPGFEATALRNRVVGIGSTLAALFELAASSDMATSVVADNMARERLARRRDQNQQPGAHQ